MALAPCRECGETVSNAAGACPHCGIRHPDATQAGRAKTASVALVIGIAAVVLLGLYLLTEMLGV